MNRTEFLRLLLLAPLGGQSLAAHETGFGQSIDYLLKCQSADGAWRSETYGAFRDGRALTPIVLRCLSRIPDSALKPRKEKAVAWLLANETQLFTSFPVHLASALLEATPFVPSLRQLSHRAVSRLLELQNPDGGWSYSPIPHKGSSTPSTMQQPNLSATTMALDGLRAARAASRLDPLPFVRSCQNFGTGAPEFDDGGCFQMPLDPSRNKAGISGKDRSGKRRFRSYAAATSDGLRCLLAMNTPSDKKRIAAAREWLDRSTWHDQPNPADLYYYTSRSIAVTGAMRNGRTKIQSGLPQDVSSKRKADGSWSNPAGEMRENCPLVATSLALEALTLCAV